MNLGIEKITEFAADIEAQLSVYMRVLHDQGFITDFKN